MWHTCVCVFAYIHNSCIISRNAKKNHGADTIQKVPLTALFKTGIMIDATSTRERQHVFNCIGIVAHKNTVYQVPQVAADDGMGTLEGSRDLQSLPHH